jgi:RNA polymerase sigma-70 factor (ECF subfamily)
LFGTAGRHGAPFTPNHLENRRLFPWIEGAADADWEALYVAQLPRVCNFFRYRVGCTADVEDLTAVTFEKAWCARHRYRRDLASFSTWLLTIARNVAVDHFRSRRAAEPLDAAAGVPATARTAEQEAVVRSDVQRLGALLSGLPARDAKSWR